MAKGNTDERNIMKNSREQGKGNSEQSNFILKAYQIVNDPKNYDIIHWSKTGYTFIIQNIQNFEQAILPRYFRHNRYQSFVRQLNMYDFHKVRNGDYYCQNKSEFRHEEFYQANYPKILDIKRKGFQAKPEPSHKIIKSHKSHSKKFTKPRKQNKISKQKKMEKEKSEIFEEQQIQQCLNQREEFSVEFHLEDLNSMQDQSQKQNYSSKYQTNKNKAISNKNGATSIDNLNIFNKGTNNSQCSVQKHLKNLKTNKTKIEQVSGLIIEQVFSEFKNRQKLSQEEKFKTFCFQKKLNQNIEIAELIKEKWNNYDTYLLARNDYQCMKEIYHQVKEMIYEHQKNIQLEHESQCDNILELICVQDQEQAIIDSIFKKDIRSTLISINSETFLNHDQNIRKFDFMMHP